MEQKEFKDIENPIFIETVTMILNNNGNCGYNCKNCPFTNENKVNGVGCPSGEKAKVRLAEDFEKMILKVKQKKIEKKDLYIDLLKEGFEVSKPLIFEIDTLYEKVLKTESYFSQVRFYNDDFEKPELLFETKVSDQEELELIFKEIKKEKEKLSKLEKVHLEVAMEELRNLKKSCEETLSYYQEENRVVRHDTLDNNFESSITKLKEKQEQYKNKENVLLELEEHEKFWKVIENVCKC